MLTASLVNVLDCCVAAGIIVIDMMRLRHTLEVSVMHTCKKQKTSEIETAVYMPHQKITIELELQKMVINYAVIIHFSLSEYFTNEAVMHCNQLNFFR